MPIDFVLDRSVEQISRTASTAQHAIRLRARDDLVRVERHRNNETDLCNEYRLSHTYVILFCCTDNYVFSAYSPFFDR